jgi:hypothetical protein
MNRLFVCVCGLCGLLGCADKVLVGSGATITCDLPTPSVNPASVTLHVGDTLRATVHWTPCGTTTSAAVFWRSTNLTVARVDSLAGLITALAAGTTVVTATAVADPTVGGAMALTVLP